MTELRFSEVWALVFVCEVVGISAGVLIGYLLR